MKTLVRHLWVEVQVRHCPVVVLQAWVAVWVVHLQWEAWAAVWVVVHLLAWVVRLLAGLQVHCNQRLK
jgi:hypothetical protein